MTTRAPTVLVLGCALFTMTACGTPRRPPAPDVTGWYVREGADAREVIDVRQDSQYVHVVAPRATAPGGTAARADTARWHAVGDSTIALDEFRAAASVGAAGMRGTRVQGALRHDGQGELVLVLPGDARPFLRRLRYGRQTGR